MSFMTTCKLRLVPVRQGTDFKQRYKERETHKTGEILEEQIVVMSCIQRPKDGGHIVWLIPSIVQANDCLYLQICWLKKKLRLAGTRIEIFISGIALTWQRCFDLYNVSISGDFECHQEIAWSAVGMT